MDITAELLTGTSVYRLTKPGVEASAVGRRSRYEVGDEYELRCDLRRIDIDSWYSGTRNFQNWPAGQVAQVDKPSVEIQPYAKRWRGLLTHMRSCCS